MFYLIIATVCFSLSFGLIKAQLAPLDSNFVVFCRLFIAFLFFLPFVKRQFDKKLVLSAIIGMVQFGVMYLCFIKAFKFLQGNEVALLTTTTPVFVALWSCLFGERFRFIYIVCILLSVLGAGIIVWQNLRFDLIIKGVVLMEMTNCSFALGQVLWKKYVGDEDAKYMASAYLGALLLVLPFMIFSFDMLSLSLSMGQILSLLYLGLVPTGIGFWLWNKGAVLVESSALAIMNNLKIPLGVMFSIFVFHEKINLSNFIIGSLIIIFSIILLEFFMKNRH